MKRVEFARLIDVSPSLVTKYADDGLIIFSDADAKRVDARATLDALAGRLDETKRQAAIAKLNAAPANESEAPPAPSPAARNAKTALDELRRDSVALDLAKRAGDVIPIVQVEHAIMDAIAKLQSVFEVEAATTADRLAIDLGLSADRKPALPRALRSLCTRARAAFAAEMAKLAGDEPQQGAAADGVDQETA